MKMRFFSFFLASGYLGGRLFPEVDPSIREMIPGHDVAVFGYQHCQYSFLRERIAAAFSVTHHTPDRELHKMFEPSMRDTGNVMEKLPRPDQSPGMICATYLSDLILENERRRGEGVPLIPILFCIDVDSNPHPISAKPEGIVSTSYLTACELRRAYELTHAEDRKIRDIALRTFHFVKVGRQRGWFRDRYLLTAVPAPWEYKSWDSLWKSRERDLSSWREDLAAAWSRPRPPPDPKPRMDFSEIC